MTATRMTSSRLTSRPLLCVRAWIAIAIATVTFVPCLVRADAVAPAPACPPGESRGGLSGVSGLAFYGHAGPPPCEPAVCSDLAPCPSSHSCRRDTHCITERTRHQIRPSYGHGSRWDRDDPASYEDVTRSYDVGACDDGHCPSGARCLVVSTCRLRDERDAAATATDLRGVPAEGAWASGVAYTDATTTPPETSTPIEPSAAAPPTVAAAPPTTTTTRTTAAPSIPPESTAPTAATAPTSGLCRASPHDLPGLAFPIALGALALALRRTRPRR